MSAPVGILICLLLMTVAFSTFVIASDTQEDNENMAMDTNESDLQSRNDYPDFDDLNSFFDFEIAPPQITYQHLKDEPKKTSSPVSNKNYYYYNSGKYPKYKAYQYHASPAEKQVVTPGNHYKSSTENTYIEGEKQDNETNGVFNQARIGQYQVSIVDANSPLLSNLGLTQEDLERLSTYNKQSVNNATMIASDSTPTATYAENPHPIYPQPEYQPPNPQRGPSYPAPYDTSNHSPQRANYNNENYRPSERYSSDATATQTGYSQSSASHPPPQGSYDPKSYRVVQGINPQGNNGYNYPAQTYHSPPQTSAQSYHPPPQIPNTSPHRSSIPYNNPQQPLASYSNPPSSAYNNPPQSNSYGPQRSSSVPWRQSSHAHTDWDDKQTKDTWQNGNYPPHPPPLPYSSNSGTYSSKPSYGYTTDKNGHRLASTYAKPESASKATYSSSTSSATEYSSHKPYYPPSSHSSSKVPSRHGSVSHAASTHHVHPSASKPGITIRFKAKAPSHGHGHGVNIPLSFSPLDVVKKLIPSLNPLNNKKVTIGITIENKKDHHEYHPY